MITRLPRALYCAPLLLALAGPAWAQSPTLDERLDAIDDALQAIGQGLDAADGALDALRDDLAGPEPGPDPTPAPDDGYGDWRPVLYQDAVLPDPEGPCSARLPLVKEVRPRPADVGASAAAIEALFAPNLYAFLEKDGRQLLEVVELDGETVFRTTLRSGDKASVNMRSKGAFNGRSLGDACVRYQVLFPNDASLARGGRVSGIFGGPNVDGGDDVVSGFSSRITFGHGASYDYYFGKQRNYGEIAQRTAKPRCISGGPKPCFEIGGGGGPLDLPDRWWTSGQWITFEHEVVLNKGAKCDGEIRAWVNGVRVLSRADMCLRAPANADYGADSLNVVGRAGSTDGPEVAFYTRGYQTFGE